jgi:hypothetical protein
VFQRTTLPPSGSSPEDEDTTVTALNLMLFIPSFCLGVIRFQFHSAATNLENSR